MSAYPTRDYFREQILRLERLDFFPRSIPGMGELVTALQQSSRSKAHCGRVVEELVSRSECPHPSDIRQIAWELLEPEVERERNRCVCGGVGFIVVERNGVSGAEPCGYCRAPVQDRKKAAAGERE